MRLEDIGFYTLSDARALSMGPESRMVRGEILITAQCNFRCPYCRGVGEELTLERVVRIVELWRDRGLRNLRLSGGEPTCHRDLSRMVRYARDVGVDRIAISTNGSAPIGLYDDLIESGANDFSVSLDACCAAGCNAMTGIEGAFDRVVESIRHLASRVYTTVGIVLTGENVAQVEETIEFAHGLGVADIRIIPAAQEDCGLHLNVGDKVLGACPILRYRVGRFNSGLRVRGLDPVLHANRCALVMDDSAVMGDRHYPCIIYMREGGNPVGCVGPKMQDERVAWAMQHDVKADPICSRNCLDVCAELNRRAAEQTGSAQRQVAPRSGNRARKEGEQV